MRTIIRVLLVFIFASGVVIGSPRHTIAIPTGSYTFTYPGEAPGNTKIRITLVTEPLGIGLAVSMDLTLDISGLNRDQATNNLRDQLAANGVQFTNNGPNSTNVTSVRFKPPDDPDNPVDLSVKKIDGGSSHPVVSVRLDGTDVNIQRGVDPGQTWKASFAPGFGPPSVGGALVINIPGVGPLSTFLADGTTPEGAALALNNLLSASGFPDVALQGTEVSFLQSPSNDLITRINDFAFEGANLHYSLEIPTPTPEPTTLFLWGSAMAGLGLARWKRRSQK